MARKLQIIVKITPRSCVWCPTLSNIVYELVLVGPMCLTLHFEVLNFNCHLSDLSINWSMSLCSSWWQTTGNNTRKSSLSSSNRNNFANLSLGKLFINNVNKIGPKTLSWGTPWCESDFGPILFIWLMHNQIIGRWHIRVFCSTGNLLQ